MSGESDLSTAARTIRESVTENLDTDELESMLESDSAPESVGRELGGRIGREVGRILGRELGQVVAVDLRERKGPRTVLADVKRRLVELLAALLRNADVESWVSRLREFGTAALSSEPSELLDTVVPDVDGEDETSEGDASEPDTSEPDQADGAAEAPEDSVGDMSADDLREMREETYRELLEVMSYSQLQSIAKEVGVKANLSEEEMTDRIVEAFSDG